MNPPPPLPSDPVLRLPRRTPTPAVTGAAAESPAEQAVLREDWASLRERELNLRAYEERLRAWQGDLDSLRVYLEMRGGLAAAAARPPSPLSPGHDPALQAAWEKFHRARQLLEAEQMHLRDDRITVRATETELLRRERAVAEREARVAAREQELRAAEPAPEAGSEPIPSVLRRLTPSPFQAARSVFGSGK